MKSLLLIPVLLGYLSFNTCVKSPNDPTPKDQPTPANRVDPEIPENVPSCIQEEIRKMFAEPVANPPASIWQYKYKEAIVYYIPAQCCDVPSRLLDENCNQICSPDGGMTGKGDGRCPDFESEQRDGKLIWKDAR